MEYLTLDLEEVDFSLIGIHSPLADYKLAYLLNQHLNFKLERFHQNLDFENSQAQFPLFEYKNKKQYIDYYLINNKHVQLKHTTNSGLFKEQMSTTSYLIPEKKKVDFFLKINGICNTIKLFNIISNIKNIPSIVTCYQIEPETLKTKNHLIF
ncbi:MAG TPA: IPExxxVDY family protein [Flavobacteriaceae bacterium]|nr:IPExxxVDY family protein [Flavobacteriaceae bacterium]